MSKILRATTLASTVAVLTLSATPALAIGPTNQNATATAHIVKPLTLNSVRNLDLGVIVLGSGTWSNATVGISRAGVFSCSNSNTTCSGAAQTAQYKITGTNNQDVTINAPNVTLTNQNDSSTLLMTVDNPGTVNLGNSGASGLTFDLGGSIIVSSTTSDGTYSGTFNVTVNY